MTPQNFHKTNPEIPKVSIKPSLRAPSNLQTRQFDSSRAYADQVEVAGKD